ncbi:ATP-binding protein [Streptomyces mashuensis]|uniref:ATP-binding protein n=1 Tax=Streptomyces mashuensis TaxID=33904 RepID=A0A919B7Z6_9ACTN|nr:ATP-binding protein [Streptomyces mashuensis]GHF68865.1 ATP-binding protein [Streptomyces mashuensis]
MSLPLTRRIARVALLVAAGAAPVVGAAGSASAADLVKAPDLGGLSAVDSANLGSGLDSTSHQAGAVATGVGTKAVHTTTGAVSKAGKEHVPAAQKAVGQVAGGAGQAVGQTAQGVTKGGLPTQALPGKGLPLGG